MTSQTGNLPSTPGKDAQQGRPAPGQRGITPSSSFKRGESEKPQQPEWMQKFEKIGQKTEGATSQSTERSSPPQNHDAMISQLPHTTASRAQERARRRNGDGKKKPKKGWGALLKTTPSGADEADSSNTPSKPLPTTTIAPTAKPPTTPQWMNKFVSSTKGLPSAPNMDPADSDDDLSVLSAASSVNTTAKTEPEWMNRFNSKKMTKPPVPPVKSKARTEPPWMQKFQRRNSGNSVSSEPPLRTRAASEGNAEPEWMNRYRDIGMSDVEASPVRKKPVIRPISKAQLPISDLKNGFQGNSSMPSFNSSMNMSPSSNLNASMGNLKPPLPKGRPGSLSAPSSPVFVGKPLVPPSLPKTFSPAPGNYGISPMAASPSTVGRVIRGSVSAPSSPVSAGKPKVPAFFSPSISSSSTSQKPSWMVKLKRQMHGIEEPTKKKGTPPWKLRERLKAEQTRKLREETGLMPHFDDDESESDDEGSIVADDDSVAAESDSGAKVPEWMQQFKKMHLQKAEVLSAQGRAPQAISRLRRGSMSMIERSGGLQVAGEPARGVPAVLRKKKKRKSRRNSEGGASNDSHQSLDASSSEMKNSHHSLPPSMPKTSQHDESSVEAQGQPSIATGTVAPAFKTKSSSSDDSEPTKKSINDQVEIDNSAPGNVMNMWGKKVKSKKPGDATLLSFRKIQNQAEAVKDRILRAKKKVDSGTDDDSEGSISHEFDSRSNSISLDNSAAALFMNVGGGGASTSPRKRASVSMDNSAAALFGFGPSSAQNDKEDSVSMENSAAALFGFEGSATNKEANTSASMDNSAAALFGFGQKSEPEKRASNMSALVINEGAEDSDASSGEKSNDSEPRTKEAEMSDDGSQVENNMDESTAGPTKKKSFLDDSESDSDSSKEEKQKPPGTTSTPEKKKSFLDESDSESDSSDDEKPKKPSSPPASVKKKSSLDDSDSDSDSSKEEKPNPPAAATTSKKKSFLDDSDSDSDSSADEKPKTSPSMEKKKSFLDDSGNDSSKGEQPNTPAATATATPEKKKSFLDDSDSDSDSSADEEPKAAVTPLSTEKKKSFLDDSDSSDDEKPKKPSSPPASVKKKSSLDDSDSDSDSSKDEKPNTPAATATATPEKKKSFLEDSDSDSDSSADEKPKAAVASPSTEKKKSFLDDSDSDSDSSDDEKPKKPSSPLANAKKKSSLDDSDSDSDSSKDEKPNTPAATATPEKKSFIESLDSDSDSGDDNIKVVKESEKFEPDADSSSDDSSKGSGDKKSATAKTEMIAESAVTQSDSLFNDPFATDATDEKAKQDAEWEAALLELQAEEEKKLKKKEEEDWQAALTGFTNDHSTSQTNDDLWSAALQDIEKEEEKGKMNSSKGSASQASSKKKKGESSKAFGSPKEKVKLVQTSDDPLEDDWGFIAKNAKKEDAHDEWNFSPRLSSKKKAAVKSSGPSPFDVTPFGASPFGTEAGFTDSSPFDTGFSASPFDSSPGFPEPMQVKKKKGRKGLAVKGSTTPKKPKSAMRLVVQTAKPKGDLHKKRTAKSKQKADDDTFGDMNDFDDNFSAANGFGDFAEDRSVVPLKAVRNRKRGRKPPPPADRKHSRRRSTEKKPPSKKKESDRTRSRSHERHKPRSRSHERHKPRSRSHDRHKSRSSSRDLTGRSRSTSMRREKSPSRRRGGERRKKSPDKKEEKKQRKSSRRLK